MPDIGTSESDACGPAVPVWTPFNVPTTPGPQYHR
jgi:hypothetical protein